MQTVIPRSYIENYSNALNLASDTAKTALVEALAAVDYTQPVDKIRDAVIAIMQVACGASTSVAARLAAEFYDGLRAYMVGDAYGAIAESMRNPAATEGAIRAFIQIIVDGGDVDAFIKMCADRLDYENRKAAKECVAENAKNDPRQAKWAIVPTGDETCPYCIILASRGFVYDNEEMASHTHANCDCRLVPAWSDDPIVQGYQAKLAEYEAFYKECEDMRNNPDMPEDLRLRIQLAKMRHDADYRAGIVKNKWSSMNELTIIARYLHPEGFINSAVEVGEVVGSKPLVEWTAAKSKKETIKQASNITFNLDGVKNSSGTKASINSLAAEYKTNLETVQPMAIVKKAEKGEVDIPTGTVMQLLSGDDQTVAHEFAHTMWSQKRLDEYRIDGSADFAKELRKIWKRYRNEALYEGEIISSYAGTSIDEFMAEAFSAYKTGKTADKFGVGKDSVYVRQVGKLIDKYFKR